MPFFTSHTPKPTKTHYPVFAGLDDPFNFPTTKMRYNTRSASPASTTDSGYGSIDDAPLSPKAHVLPKNRRQLQKDNTGHWRVQSYEHERRSDNTDHATTGERILASSVEAGPRWAPDPKRTFTAMCVDAAKPPSTSSAREKWYTKRLYGGKTSRKDMTELQRSMAPTLRRAAPAPSLSLLSGSGSGGGRRHAETRSRKPSTLLHPSAPALPACPRTSDAAAQRRPEDRNAPRGRPRTVSSRAGSAPCALVLRNPRNRSPTPLGIPTSSESQPAPTPLRIRIGARSASAESVLHSCFSGSEAGDETDGEEGGGSNEGLECGFESAVWMSSVEVEIESEAESIESAVGSTVGGQGGGQGGVILARTALVARAQRVRVRSPGAAKGAGTGEMEMSAC